MHRLLLALLLITACTAEQPSPTTETGSGLPEAPTPPTVAEAQTIIDSAPEFGEFEFTNAAYSIPVAATSMNEATLSAAKDLAREGWVGFDGAGDLVLTDKAQADKRFILRPNGILDIVPLAKKEMGEVQGVATQEDETVTADFRWRWIPNEVGLAFRSGPLHERYAAAHNATATLMWNGTSWVLLKIERR
ncbi:MAG TPA: hypothetical protein VF701_08095 [Thermoanaerobaculia bacterium]